MTINNHIIDLVEKHQPSYKPIYNLKEVEMENLKIYIENKLANGFIKIFKSLADTFILFVKQLNGSFRLYMDYQDVYNLTIKN